MPTATRTVRPPRVLLADGQMAWTSRVSAPCGGGSALDEGSLIVADGSLVAGSPAVTAAGEQEGVRPPVCEYRVC